MNTTTLPLVTIVAESILHDRLIEELKKAGAKGYTACSAEGDGSRHLRSGELLGDNVRIEAIVSEAVAEKVLNVLARDYFPYFALIVYVSDVRVVRGDKYV